MINLKGKHLIMMVLWTYHGIISQKLTSTLPEHGNACPGEKITFNCVVMGSEHLTSLILAWSSEEYIGRGNFLQFTTSNQDGDSTEGTRADNVTASLISVGSTNGIPSLTSELSIVLSVTFPKPTITCHSLSNGSESNIQFDVIAIPGKPTEASATELPIVIEDRCVLLMVWSVPIGYDEDNIDHYVVIIPALHIRTLENSTLVSIPLQKCVRSLNIKVSVVNRCGEEGQSAVVMPQFHPAPSVGTSPQSPTVSDDRLVVGVVIGIGIGIGIGISFAVVVAILCYYLYWRAKRRMAFGYNENVRTISAERKTSDAAVTTRDENPIFDIDKNMPAKGQLPQDPMGEDPNKLAGRQLEMVPRNPAISHDNNDRQVAIMPTAK